VIFLVRSSSSSAMSAAAAAPLTTSWGAPVDDNENSLSVGSNGPLLLQDTHLLDKLAHFDRERIPERAVHAKGAGAHGYFEITHDITKYSKAKVFAKVGQRTPIFARFSTVGGERGSADTARDPRICHQALHHGGHLGHGGKQHAHLLHSRPYLVP